MTKDMYIETFEAMRNNARACEKIWKQVGNRDMELSARREWITIDTIIQMLKSDAFAREIRSCHIKE